MLEKGQGGAILLGTEEVTRARGGIQRGIQVGTAG
jgi:hypothetical protein